MSGPRVHVIGAGLAGLSAATRLAAAGVAIDLHEGAAHVGGRCRSYLDPQLDMLIDNGNHLVLSGNAAVADYLQLIGARDRVAGPQQASISFVDLDNGARWTLRPNSGVLPWWIFAPERRVPDASAGDHLQLARLLAAPDDALVGDVITARGPIWRRLIHPLLLAALNTEPTDAAAGLARAIITETFAKGGAACMPRIARPSLAAAFIDPALNFLRQRGARIHLGARATHVRFDAGRATAFATRGGDIRIGPNDVLIIAVPAAAAGDLLPDLNAPNDFRAILNVHFKIATGAAEPAMLGVVGGMAEWIFTFDDRISVTISAADRLLDADREALAADIWQDVRRALRRADSLPPWQIVKERRATISATPAQEARRPDARTRWRNLFLAGDWTRTGLPGTIEGALRSGRRAAELALAELSARAPA